LLIIAEFEISKTVRKELKFKNKHMILNY
jgi:hypothetical protein